MVPITKKEIIEQVAYHLSEWLKASKYEVRVRDNLQDEKIDGHLDVAGYELIIEAKSNSRPSQILSAIQALKHFRLNVEKSVIPLIAVPFMGEVGRKLCEEACVSWLDLSGNANISAPNLRILIDGRPNRFKSLGRPSNTFAPKSSRIARWLLMYADQAMSQREIARATNMEEGFTSRIVSRLVEDGLISRSDEGLIHVPDPVILLDSWKERYNFSKHQIIKGHIAARSSDELLKKTSSLFSKDKVPHAATGLGAAWLYTKFSGFRIVTFYLKTYPSDKVIDSLGFREDPRGANVWLVIPQDEGVFHGSEKVEGIQCVHPVQVYLDLFGHPERAKEAANRLRQELLNWSRNA